MVAQLNSSQLQKALESVVRSIQWTYSLFWQLCPQQGVLVWSDGYYNGAIKTRKMVQRTELSSEEVLQQRGQQLKELYDCLLVGEEKQEEQRPSDALLPEDLTEVEWFYLMCISFSFPPGVGLPGNAFAKKRHIWLNRANQADSKAFSRAILAKSARVQTVVCIPAMDGVLELGTVEKVQEDAGLVQHAKSFFTDFQDKHTKSMLLEHSISGSVAYIKKPVYQCGTMMQQMCMKPHGSRKEDYTNDDDEEDDDQTDEDENDDQHDEAADDVNASSKSENEARNYRVEVPLPTNLVEIFQKNIPTVEPSGTMQFDMSEEIRLGSPDRYSSELDTALESFAACLENNGQNDNQRLNDDSYQAWNVINGDLCNTLQEASVTQSQGFSPEDIHYSQTISCIMEYSLNNWTDSTCSSCHSCDSPKSAFSKWNPRMNHQHSKSSQGNSQWLLRKILSNFHCKYKNGNSADSGDGDPQKRNAQEEISANHVLAERRRREKINERFITLRSIVPFVTKMDKASILGDTIEYIKQLKKRIHDIEEKNKQTENDRRLKAQETDNTKDPTFPFNGNTQTNQKTGNKRRLALSEKKKMRSTVDGETVKLQPNLEASSTNVQVSIIESDALLEIQCKHTKGLLLKIMQTLDDVRLEITSIQCSTINTTFIAELRAKVKEAHEKRVSIVEVKKAMKQIFLSN